MDAMPELVRSSLPKAYNGCTCHCHRQQGVMHFTACCSPVINPILDMKAKNVIDTEPNSGL